METDTATAGRPRACAVWAAAEPSERREPLGAPEACAQPQSMPTLVHCARLCPSARHMSQMCTWAEQSSPYFWHCGMECVNAKHLSHLVTPTEAQPTPGAGVGAGVAELAAGVGRAVGPRTCCSSGQQCISLQQGNIHATSLGTKQQADFASCMQL